MLLVTSGSSWQQMFIYYVPRKQLVTDSKAQFEGQQREKAAVVKSVRRKMFTGEKKVIFFLPFLSTGVKV